MPPISRTVLICEDEELVRRLVVAALAPDGYDVREAADVGQALASLASGRPDLVILDFHMPGGDGLAVLERVRSDPELASTRVLLVSGTVDALDASWAERVGADGHLSKPFPVEKLREAVRALLSS